MLPPAPEARHAQAILDAALDAVVGMDDAGRVTHWNDRAAGMFGWSREEALGRDVADLIMPERYREQHRRGLRAYLATGEGPILGRRVEAIGLRRDGSEFPAELSVSPWRDGGRVGFNAFVADVTERSRAEEALRESEERYRALYQKERSGRERADRLRTATQALASSLELRTVLALILKELQGVVAYDSASVQEVRGDRMEITGGHGFLDISEVLGVSFDLGGPGTPNYEVFVTRAPVVVDNAPAAYPVFAKGVHAATPIHSWMGIPLLFGDRMIGMLSLDKREQGFYTREHVRLAESFAAHAAVAIENARLYAAAKQEVAERQRLEEQFRQSQKMEAVGRLAGGIAHDFNNLLGVIIGYTELAVRQIDEASPAHPKLLQVRKAAERAAALTGQLLAFSRKQVLVPEVLDLAEVIDDLQALLQRVIGEDIALDCVVHAGLGTVRADRGQLGQAIVNLAVNARDAMARGGRLTIEVANVDIVDEFAGQHPGVQAGPYVMLAVTDTGTGMAAGVVSHVFEPFFTTKEQGKGTGLGLAMVYGFLKQSGGHITVSSEEGRGATFKLYLPRLADSERAAQPAAPAAEAVGGWETVLVAEDEPSLRSLAGEILRGGGYEVLEAESGERALQVAQEHVGPIHVLLSDVIMPGLGGREVAEALRRSRPDTRVLFMSGYTDDAMVQRGILADEAAFIQKPFGAAALLRALRGVLDPQG